MKICITQDLQPHLDIISGMFATVEHFYQDSQTLRVLTASGRRVVLYKWENPREPKLPVHFPLRPGYASNVKTFNESRLPHVTLFLDARNVPGAVYSALSRVETAEQYQLGGHGVLDPTHFTPVDVTGLT